MDQAVIAAKTETEKERVRLSWVGILDRMADTRRKCHELRAKPRTAPMTERARRIAARWTVRASLAKVGTSVETHPARAGIRRLGMRDKS